MKNKDLYHYISHFGDFSPVTIKIDIVTNEFNDNFVFASSEKSDEVEPILVNKQNKEEKYYF